MGLDEALGAFQDRLYERPQLIILELKDLPEGEERVRALAGLGIPTILISGVSEEQRAIFQGIRWTALLKRPVSIGRVVQEVERQVKILKTQGGGDASWKKK